MVIKVYVSMISCSQEVKKNQQRAVMILESKNIPFTTIDITDPGQEDAKDYMNENAKPKGDNKVPQTPQIFNEADYCGDFDDLDMANETDTLGEFLNLTDEEKKGIKIGITGILPEERARAAEQKKEGLTNGVGRENEKIEDVNEIAESVVEDNATEAQPTEDAGEVPNETTELIDTSLTNDAADEDAVDIWGSGEGADETPAVEEEAERQTEEEEMERQTEEEEANAGEEGDAEEDARIEDEAEA